MLTRTTASTLLLALASCAAPPVFTDLDPSANFSDYETYGFLKPTSMAAAPAEMNPMVPGHLEHAAASDLDALGYRPCAVGESPDLVVSFTLGSRDRVQVTEYPSFYDRGRYGWGGPYYQETDVRRYTEGTLCVDFFDPTRDAPVWHGKTARTVTQKLRKDPASAASEVVGAILARFPARPDAGAATADSGPGGDA